MSNDYDDAVRSSDNLPLEVYNFRLNEYNGDKSSRRGYFKVKIYVGETEWLDVDSFKLMWDNTGKKGHYVLPPSEKTDGGWRDYAKYSNTLRDEITSRAVLLYNSLKS